VVSTQSTTRYDLDIFFFFFFFLLLTHFFLGARATQRTSAVTVLKTGHFRATAFRQSKPITGTPLLLDST
jgi:hypothetical protein